MASILMTMLVELLWNQKRRNVCNQGGIFLHDRIRLDDYMTRIFISGMCLLEECYKRQRPTLLSAVALSTCVYRAGA